jgi:predicted HTH domain antitoxin
VEIAELSKEYRMRKVANYYQKGIMSLQEAATQAKVTLYEMMDYLQKEKITAPPQTSAEIEEDLRYSQTIFQKLT